MYSELIEKIKKHTLGDKEEASSLYFVFCDCLKEKYGLVDRDYDDNPTRRGKEWIDIHHIREYELDDIARRTEFARNFEKNSRSAIFEFSLDYTLEKLKPYNVKKQLVYANKIEHFLLHYLIDTIRGQNIFSGGPNYLWDCSVALDIYGFDEPFMNNLKSKKDNYYSIISSEEVTLLYKKLIDWKGWKAKQCSSYWMINKNVIRYLDERQVSYVEDKDKFFKLLAILGIAVNENIKNKIVTLPYKAQIIERPDGTKIKKINNNLYSMDEKTIIHFRLRATLKSFTVPTNIERIASGAFFPGFCLEKITIPITVKEIEDKAFTGYPENFKSNCSTCANLKKIYYDGTKEMWDSQFPNVEIPNGVILVCKKK